MAFVRRSTLPWRSSPILWSLFVLAAICDVEAQQASSPPGAKGPRVEILAAPPKGIELLWLAVVNDFSQVGNSPKQGDRERSLPQMLPSGTETLKFLIDFKQRPPSGTVISIEVVNKSGPVKFPAFTMMVDVQALSGEDRVEIERKPETGPYPDGPYAATVTIDDKAVARLNWSIGN